MNEIITQKSKKERKANLLSAEEIERRVMRAFKVIGSEAVLPSKILEDIFEIRHDNIIRMIEREVKRLDLLTSEMRSQNSKSDPSEMRSQFFIESTYKSRGKDYKQYLLTEQGFMFISMGMNNIVGSAYRMVLTKLFYKMRHTIIENKLRVEYNKKYPIVIEARKSGKEVRRNLTDTIQKYIIVERIKDGKTKNQHIYTNFSRLLNKIVGVEVPKCVETRDLLDKEVLDKVNQIEQIMAETIEKCAKDGMHYKDIYKAVKRHLEE